MSVNEREKKRVRVRVCDGATPFDVEKWLPIRLKLQRLRENIFNKAQNYFFQIFHVWLQNYRLTLRKFTPQPFFLFFLLFVQNIFHLVADSATTLHVQQK